MGINQISDAVSVEYEKTPMRPDYALKVVIARPGKPVVYIPNPDYDDVVKIQVDGEIATVVPGGVGVTGNVAVKVNGADKMFWPRELELIESVYIGKRVAHAADGSGSAVSPQGLWPGTSMRL